MRERALDFVQVLAAMDGTTRIDGVADGHDLLDQRGRRVQCRVDGTRRLERLVGRDARRQCEPIGFGGVVDGVDIRVGPPDALFPPALDQNDRATIPKGEMREYTGDGPAVAQRGAELGVGQALDEAFETLSFWTIFRTVS